MSDADLLVIGGGMAALGRRLVGPPGTIGRAGREGALGGTAVQAGFIWTAPTYEVLREQVPDGDPALQRTLIDGFEGGVEWVRSLQIECLPAVTVLRFGRGHQTDMTNYLRLCEKIVRDDPASEILVPAEPDELIREDGAVAGAVVKLPDGGRREIRAGSTLLATGGFQADRELRKTIHPNAAGFPLRSNPTAPVAGPAGAIRRREVPSRGCRVLRPPVPVEMKVSRTTTSSASRSTTASTPCS